MIWSVIPFAPRVMTLLVQGYFLLTMTLLVQGYFSRIFAPGNYKDIICLRACPLSLVKLPTEVVLPISNG
jgi:hypothetical protein